MQAPKDFELLFSADSLKKTVAQVASDIDKKISDDAPLLGVAVLKGAWIFHADLCRQISRPVEVDFIRVASYGAGKESSGEVKLSKDIEADVTGKHVLLIEDIIDTGRTLKFLKERLEKSGAKSVHLVALLDKPSRRVVDCNADFVGETIEDRFVVGYGLDWDEKYRSLEGIYCVPD